MLSFLRGKIFESSDGKITLLVGSEETGAVGYSVYVSQSMSTSTPIGKTIDLFIHTHVREDTLDLYGFSQKIEKDLFLTLLSVTGIGPKVAIGILSKVDATHLIQAILDADKEFLVQIPGIGKKTAERVVLELADPIRKKVESGIFSLGTRAAGDTPKKSNKNSAEFFFVRDARDALVSLGYKENEIGPVIQRILEESEEKPRGAEELIRSALQQLA